jgi:hypothetical protein
VDSAQKFLNWLPVKGVLPALEKALPPKFSTADRIVVIRQSADTVDPAIRREPQLGPPTDSRDQIRPRTAFNHWANKRCLMSTVASDLHGFEIGTSRPGAYQTIVERILEVARRLRRAAFGHVVP